MVSPQLHLCGSENYLLSFVKLIQTVSLFTDNNVAPNFLVDSSLFYHKHKFYQLLIESNIHCPESWNENEKKATNLIQKNQKQIFFEHAALQLKMK